METVLIFWDKYLIDVV